MLSASVHGTTLAKPALDNALPSSTSSTVSNSSRRSPRGAFLRLQGCSAVVRASHVRSRSETSVHTALASRRLPTPQHPTPRSTSRPR